MKLTESIGILFLIGIATVAGNMVGYKAEAAESVIGYLIMAVVTTVGLLITRFLPFKVPMVVCVSLVAILITSELSPVAKTVSYYTGKVDFLALTTPILAYAGLSVGKDLKEFQKISWRIIVVAIAAFTGTFLFAAIIAQVALKLQGII